MNEFKSVILGICIASTSLGAMYMLKPNGKMQKTVRFGFAVIFLALTISLAISLFKNKNNSLLTLSPPDYTAAEKIAEIEIQEITATIMEEKGFNYSEIKVFTNNDASGGIFIKRITVKTRENPKLVKESICSVINADEVEVINE